MKSLRWGAILLTLSFTLTTRAQDRLDEKSVPFQFSRENVLGTSFDLKVRADSEESAKAVESAVLAAVDRACKVLSNYDPASEISRINAQVFKSGEAIGVSGELYELLAEAAAIQKNSGGAFNAYLGDVLELWRSAGKSGQEPEKEALAKALEGAKAGFRVRRDRRQMTLTRLGPGRFQLDAIAKGFIMDRAAQAGMRVRGCHSLMLDIGGEIIATGESWELGIADPKRSEDNAPPLTRVSVRNLALATSGDYARSIKVGEGSRNHIIDARTGIPARGVTSATVISGRASEADALATALCVLTPAEGIELVEKRSGAVCLLVDASGKIYRSRGFAAFEVASPAAPPPASSAWPKDYRAVLSFTLKDSSGGSDRRFKRHFVGAWVEDSCGRRVRILAVWAERKELKYIRDLDEFWKFAWVLPGGGDNPSAIASISRATRAPGEYKLLWDGLDDSGKPVPQGRYVIKIDINREKGPPSGREIHTAAALEIECKDTAMKASAADQPELGSVSVSYGPDDRKKF